jgi:hypothetical protein
MMHTTKLSFLSGVLIVSEKVRNKQRVEQKCGKNEIVSVGAEKKKLTFAKKHEKKKVNSRYSCLHPQRSSDKIWRQTNLLQDR